MKTTTVPTAPFLYNYKIWDTIEKEYVYTCTHRKDVYRTHTLFFNEWVYKEVPVWRSRYSSFYDSARPKTRQERDYRRYKIIDHFGDEIEFDELHKQYGGPNRRWRLRIDGGVHNDKKPDVRYKKGNPNKIKSGYHNGSWWDDDYKLYHYDHVTSGWYRAIRTHGERKRNAADVAEYGHTIVRGKRRGTNLPTSWDDERNATCEHLNSWKNHSKRRHQWKPKVDDA